jgi:peptidoglycan/LPS O-acetylase OafA/YrhL
VRAEQIHCKNNFDFLRLLAAALVIYGHAVVLKGLPNQSLWGTPIHVVGVFIFFSISGYLITDSWSRSPRVGLFAWKRFLRLGPALVVVVALTTLLFGPAVTSLPISQYFASADTWFYFGNIVLLYTPDLTGVFTDQPFPGMVNGSLWSLPVEVACYATVPLLGCFIAPRLRALILYGFAGASGLIAVYMFSRYLSTRVFGTEIGAALSVAPFFMSGAALRALQPRLPLRLDVALMLVMLILIIEARFPEALPEVLWFCLPYVVIAFGLSSTPIIRNAALFGDFSYGLYLYAYPIQRLLIEVIGARAGLYAYVLVSGLCAGCFAIASWHLIEKRALRFKARKPTSLEKTSISTIRRSVATSRAAADGKVASLHPTALIRELREGFRTERAMASSRSWALDEGKSPNNARLQHAEIREGN